MHNNSSDTTKQSSWEAILKLEAATPLQVVEEDPFQSQQTFDWEMPLLPAQPTTKRPKAVAAERVLRSGRSRP